MREDANTGGCCFLVIIYTRQEILHKSRPTVSVSVVSSLSSRLITDTGFALGSWVIREPLVYQSAADRFTELRSFQQHYEHLSCRLRIGFQRRSLKWCDLMASICFLLHFISTSCLLQPAVSWRQSQMCTAGNHWAVILGSFYVCVVRSDADWFGRHAQTHTKTLTATINYIFN